MYKIKPLKWEAEQGGGKHQFSYYWAKAIGFNYHIKVIRVEGKVHTVEYGTNYQRNYSTTSLEAAQAACQAHWEILLLPFMEKEIK